MNSMAGTNISTLLVPPNVGKGSDYLLLKHFLIKLSFQLFESHVKSFHILTSQKSSFDQCYLLLFAKPHFVTYIPLVSLNKNIN